jgi:hypothetical protein
MNNYPREQNDTVSVEKPWGKGRLTHDFSGPLASRNPNTGNNRKPIGFQNRFDAFDKRKNNRGFEHENNFQEVNQQNSCTRIFSLISVVSLVLFPCLCFRVDCQSAISYVLP